MDSPSSYSPHDSIELTVAPGESGWRLDLFLVHYLPDYSRMHLRRVITAGEVSVDGRGGKPSYRLKPGQRVSLVLPELPREAPKPENIPLDVLYEDDDLAVVNKPSGMVVHPARGHWAGTLASALSYRFAGQLSSTGGPTRPGIVHRLDRDTSGVILVAKNDQAHRRLAFQFESRTIEKEYAAIVVGVPQRDRDCVDVGIGPHPQKREKMMAVPKVTWTKISRVPRSDAKVEGRSSMTRQAETYFEVAERFDRYALVRAMPKTGRTHQVRIHMAYAGFPVLCDKLYGHQAEITRGQLIGDPEDQTVLLARQALHARWLAFAHPETGRRIEIEAPLPDDMQSVLEALRSK